MDHDKAVEFFDAACSSAAFMPSLHRESQKEGSGVQPENYHYRVDLRVASLPGIVTHVEMLGMIKLAEKAGARTYEIRANKISLR